MISWTTVASFTTSNKPGTKWWLLKLIRQMLAASRTMQVSLWQPFLLVGPILSCTMASLITWLPHSSLWQTQLSARQNCTNNTFPWTVFKGAKWMSKRGTKSRTLLQLDENSLSSHQGWSGLVIRLWLQSQHPMKELCDPAKNPCKCMVKSPHKINYNPKMKMNHSVPEENKIYRVESMKSRLWISTAYILSTAINPCLA